MERLSTEELKRRAAGLLALGNSPARIRAALEGLGASLDQIDEVMATIETRYKQKEQADSRLLWWLGGAASVLMGLIIFAVILLLEQPAAPTTNSNGTVVAGTLPPVQVQAQTLLPGLPPGLIPKEIPSDIPPDFMAATPVVIPNATSNGNAAKCPRSDIEAANVFGGEVEDWEYNSQSNGWSLTNVGSGVTITVPDGMVAGYMTIVDSIEMVSVDGPVTIENVNFIAISCP